MYRIAISVVACTVGLGCGVDIGEITPTSTQRVYADGIVYVLNNIRPESLTVPRRFYISYQGVDTWVPHNVTFDGEPTLVGAIPITQEPLPGGTQVDFVYVVEEVRDLTPRNLSALLGQRVVIDGDITIEFFSSAWEGDAVHGVFAVQPDARVYPGYFGGMHEY